MPKYLHIQVDKPCHENWEQMQATPAGNFCNACQKTVIDFTGMTDNQLLEYFTKHPSGVCGRVYTDQLAQKMEMPVKHIPWMKYFFSITLPAMLISYKANAQRLIKKYKEPVVVTDKKMQVPLPVMSEHELSGRITGNNGEPVPYASVMIAGTSEGAAADSNGLFTLRLTGTERFLEVTAVGYEKKLVTISDSRADVQLKIALKENIVLDAVLIRSYSSITMGAMVCGVTRRYFWNKKKTEIAEKPQTIELFPNPAKRNGQLTIRFKKPVNTDQQIILYNASGIKLLQETLPVKQPLVQTQLSLDLQTAGYYLIEVIDAKTHERQVAKLIVE